MRSKDPKLMERIKTAVEEYARNNGGAVPSTREIANMIGTNHVKVYRYLVEMDELGMIRYVNGEIHTEYTDKLAPVSTFIPAVTGGASCGSAAEIERSVDEYIPVPPMLVDYQRGDYILLTAYGDSMMDAMIAPGDVVIIKLTRNAREGDIVAVIVEGGLQLKLLQQAFLKFSG